MGASNFWWLKLADNHYSFWFWDDWEFDYDLVLNAVKEELENIWVSVVDEYTWRDNAKTIGRYTIENYSNKLQENRYIKFRLFIEFWYYEWARFDVEAYEWYEPTITMEKQGKVFVNKVNKIYKKYTTPLKVTASFSNGETRYEKA